MSEIGPSFDFPALLDELQGVVALEFLDRPSRFALALTCRPFYDRFFLNGILKSDSPFSYTWVFMDDCARLGLLTLLQWAHSTGARLDPLVLEAAIEASQAETAQWLIETLKSRNDGDLGSAWYLHIDGLDLKLRKLGDLAARKGLVEVARQFFSLTSSPDPEFLLASSLLAGGHIDIALSIKTFPITSSNRKNPSDSEEVQEERERAFPGNELEAAAYHGDFALFQRLYQESQNPLSDAPALQLLGLALEGENLELIRFVWENEVRPLNFSPVEVAKFIESDLLSDEKFSILRRPDIIKFLMEVCPDLDRKQGLFGWSCVNPHIETFKFLFPTMAPAPRSVNHVRTIFCTYWNAISSEDVALMRETRDARMECLRFAYENGWRWEDIESCGHWTHLDDLKWLLEKCTSPLNDIGYTNTLTEHLRTHLVADPNLLALFLDKSNRLFVFDVFEMVFLSLNGTDLLERFGLKIKSLVEHPGEIILECVEFLGSFGSLGKHGKFLVDKLRPRPRHWARVVRVMLRQGWAEGKPIQLMEMLEKVKIVYPEFDVTQKDFPDLDS